MLSLVARIFWGTPIRRVASVLGGIIVMPAWVFNFENWLEVNGYNKLLTDSQSPLLLGINFAFELAYSVELRWAVLGALIALASEGLWRLKKERDAATTAEAKPKNTPSPEDPAYQKKMQRINESLTQAYKTLGFALGASDRLSYDLAVASCEALIVGLGRGNNFDIPKLHSDGTEAGTLRALMYLNAITPALCLDDDVEARKRAAEIVPRIDALSAAELRQELGIPSPFPPTVPPTAVPAKAITASSNIEPSAPHYEFAKAVLQVADLKITRSAQSDGALVRVDGAIVIESHCYMALKQCRIIAVSLGEGVVERTLNGVLFAGKDPVSRQENGEFEIGAGKTKSLPLITRDLKDRVSEPPFVIRLAGNKIPINEDTTYVLTIELESEAKDTTRARIEIQTRRGADFSLTLIDQVVKPR